MRYLIPLCLTLAACSPGGGNLNAFSSAGQVIAPTALDAASTSFSVDLESVRGIWDILTVYFCVTDANNSVTAINMVCTASHNDGTLQYTLQDCTTAAGVCTSNSASWVKDPSAMTTKCWPWRVTVTGLPYVTCTVTDTGGIAADSITAYATMATGG